VRTLGILLVAATFAHSPALAQTQTADVDESSAADPRQPHWTARPLFSETQVYVLPKGVAAFVFDLRPTTGADGQTVTQSAYRAEFGLPARFQLGLRAAGQTNGRGGAVGKFLRGFDLSLGVLDLVDRLLSVTSELPLLIRAFGRRKPE